ncbi:glycosyltransferase family 4 protein [Candidatus Thiosymbion oneisti]|uniref:glycosyltransferase family 4 protein n=1 Tax=Candidatus Thiosymbion oneisti TaxID=589554 RepID=UPI000ABB6DEC|nr:glycosyltransferase family 4 protein [Candidatus Thiosymbion oneisti]
MRILISHFHLQTGGVSRVIEHASTALAAAGHRVLVVAGEPPRQPLPEGVGFAPVPALAYEERRPVVGPAELAAALVRAARKGLGDMPDLWHIHNHCLGKNLALPEALCTLARQGQRLLLQPHDFAEDGRPDLYARLLEELGGRDRARLSALLYPQAAHLHYAVINDRDRGFLAAAGIPHDRLHLLPNAVNLSPPADRSADPFPDLRLWLYPTRAIRRKNLGELLLWATLAPEQDLFATTQAPQNPAEQPRYRRWVALAQALGLGLEFELGNRIDDFPALLASAHALVTTSVAEGFGLAFLEPWLAGRPLVGRDLPEITRDFVAAGLDLGGLYERLEVPLDWLDRDRLRGAMDQALTDLAAAYGRPRTPDDLGCLWASSVHDGHIDFGRLDETAQEEVIRHLASNPHDRASLRPARLPAATPVDRIAHNRTLAERDYSIAGYGRRLERIYRSLLDATVDPNLGAADGTVLLERFLAPERLFLLRT